MHSQSSTYSAAGFNISSVVHHVTNSTLYASSQDFIWYGHQSQGINLVALVLILRAQQKYSEKICNINQLCNMNYFVYLFVIVMINFYIGVLKSVSCHVAIIRTQQRIINNTHNTNHSHDLWFSLFQLIHSFQIFFMSVQSCYSLWYNESKTSLPTQQ